MYFLDPVQGRRRRALVRDQCTSFLAQSGNATRKITRDLGNRTQGMLAEAQSAWSEEQVNDEVLAARVRSKLGRMVSHPKAIEVTTNQGRVTLHGPILAHEVRRLMRAVWSVRGVQEVDNQLRVYEQADGIPSLQGGTERREVSEIWQTNWTPGLRAVMGLAGGALAIYGLTQRQALGIATGLVGTGMLVRAVTNKAVERLLGISGHRRAIEIQKTINIQAPVEEVYNFWTNYENFPRFLSHITEVRNLGDGRSHWRAQGPTGTEVSWDAEITICEPNRILGWRSTPGSRIGNAGIVHFSPQPDGSTRLRLQLSYSPPAGAIGHAGAWFFGTDRKTTLDADLMRLKALLEHGKTTADDQQRTE
jgi:uncharacterized membrane protein